MSHMFSKKAKVLPDASELPQPPTIDQIVEDLDAAKPDDIVFTTDIGVDIDKVIQQDLCEISCSLQKRFQQKGNKIDGETKDLKNSKDNNSDKTTQEHQKLDDLYEKVIEYNQNVEKLITLHQTLPNVLQNLSQLHEELEEDKDRVSDTYKEAVKLYQEVNAQEKNQKSSE